MDYDNNNILRPPFQRELTLILTKDKGSALANDDVEAIKKGHTTFRVGPLEMYFHQLRLRIAQEPNLAKKIAVFFLDEENVLREIGMNFEEELRWPAGFLKEAWDIEIEISKTRHPRLKALMNK